MILLIHYAFEMPQLKVPVTISYVACSFLNKEQNFLEASVILIVLYYIIVMMILQTLYCVDHLNTAFLLIAKYCHLFLRF